MQTLSTRWWSKEVFHKLCKLIQEELGSRAALCGRPFLLFHGWFLLLATLAYAERMEWSWTLQGPISCAWTISHLDQWPATSKLATKRLSTGFCILINGLVPLQSSFLQLLPSLVLYLLVTWPASSVVGTIIIAPKREASYLLHTTAFSEKWLQDPFSPWFSALCW